MPHPIIGLCFSTLVNKVARCKNFEGFLTCFLFLFISTIVPKKCEVLKKGCMQTNKLRFKDFFFFFFIEILI